MNDIEHLTSHFKKESKCVFHVIKLYETEKFFFIISTGNACDVKFQQKSFVKAMSIFVFYENNVIPAKSWLNKL